jgi:hypothetical protein
LYAADVNGKVFFSQQGSGFGESISSSGVFNNNNFFMIDKNGQLYIIDNNGYFYITKNVEPGPGPGPSPNICFTADSMIETDKGLVRVTDLDAKKHKLQGNSFICVVKSKNQEKEMICLEKHALNENQPFTKTLISKEHKIMYDGKLERACDLVNDSTIYPVEYDGDNLYNILFEHYNTYKMNGLTVESLHPKNPRAQEIFRIIKYLKKMEVDAKKKRNGGKLTKMNIQMKSWV